LQTPSDLYDMALQYLRVYFLGMIGSVVYNMGSGILRAVGDAKRPVYILIATVIINIVLDLLFTAGLRPGVPGAAAATAISPDRLQTPSDLYDMALQYLRVYFLGMIGSVVYNMGSGILRAVGDAKRPVYILIATVIINIVLDLLFTAGLRLGVQGAAAATAIS